MSGLVSPKSIGLTNKEEIYKLVKITKRLFIICKYNLEVIIPIITFFISFIPFFMNLTVIETLVYGIPHSILFSMCSYYGYSINIWQIVYLYLTSRYIKIKLNELNAKLSHRIRKRLSTNSRYINNALFLLNSIYSEINEYNVSFWSKYLLSIWLIIGSVITNCLYFSSFIQMNKLVKCLIEYFVIIIIISFLFIINTVSSVNYEANKSYKLLNSIMVYNVRNHKNIMGRKYKTLLFYRSYKVYLLIIFEMYLIFFI